MTPTELLGSLHDPAGDLSSVGYQHLGDGPDVGGGGKPHTGRQSVHGDQQPVRWNLPQGSHSYSL